MLLTSQPTLPSCGPLFTLRWAATLEHKLEHKRMHLGKWVLVAVVALRLHLKLDALTCIVHPKYTNYPVSRSRRFSRHLWDGGRNIWRPLKPDVYEKAL